jgi:phosphatidylglycerol---prolipoprotein diacylglyceryl transferase
MLQYSSIDPVAFGFGPLRVHWYGLMYLVGFLGGWWLGRRRASRPGSGWTLQQVDDVVFYSVLGVVLGGRLGYMLFYGTQQLVADPFSILRIWQGGMSFHGGLVGVLVALWLFGRRNGKGFLEVGDFLAPLTPIGLGAGRIGNFINGELWGRATEVAWGIQLPCQRFPEHCLPGADWSTALHPSQLYEALLEGLVLFLILWLFSRRSRPLGAVSGLFLLGYGLFRFLVELVRVPDAHLGYLAWDWLTMGQVLTLPMLLAGALLLGWAYRRQPLRG